jgi:hypothetical protein
MFGIKIVLKVSIDPQTGLPIVNYYTNDGSIEQKPFVPIDCKIPEKYTKYIEQHGHHFHSYLRAFVTNSYKCSIDEFIENYPSWDQLKDDNEYLEDDWSHSDHLDYRDFMVWMKNSSYEFELEWCH